MEHVMMTQSFALKLILVLLTIAGCINGSEIHALPCPPAGSTEASISVQAQSDWLPGESCNSAFVCVQSIAFGAAGKLWVTVSRIHEGGAPSHPYSLLRISIPQK